MSTLSREHRRLLENTVAQARAIAEEGARKVLSDQYAVHHHEPWPHMSADDRKLRNQLRAHGRQVGDRRDPRRETQEIKHLVQACAYEHWHRMLFARFLAENDLLLDAQHGVAMTLDEVRELAREQGRDWMAVAAELAQRMLLAVFRPDDPVLKVQLPLETRQQLEEKLSSLPKEIFQADDSLGWVYQFWQSDEKDRVTRSEVKIGADELPAVTQLFTEDYMVLCLLENTLGAWWTARRRAEGRDPALPGYKWTYLRFNEDGSPIARTFDGWPRASRDLRALDPCMGSGHFLVFALPILTRMRMEEERLSLKEALYTVLKDNLFGLEIDARCSQIAAFNLALAAWRLAGEHFQLPEMNLACSGLGINASEADWVRLAGDDYVADQWMRRLYSLFRDAPTLGSLIDPTKYLEKNQEAGFERVLPIIEEALERERSAETRELAIAAQGVLAAFRILVSGFTLIATNVPYLGRGKQSETLQNHCEQFHSDAKADLSTCFLDRCLAFATKDSAGTIALVTPQNWFFLSTYKKFRVRLLQESSLHLAVRLGPNAFRDMNWWAATTALWIASTGRPGLDALSCGIDVSSHKAQEAKAMLLRGEGVEGTTSPIARSYQRQLRAEPDSIIVFRESDGTKPLSEYASSNTGLQTGDNDRYSFLFWELPALNASWEFFHRTAVETCHYGGRTRILRWEGGKGDLANEPGSVIRGLDCRGKRGVLVHRMNQLNATLYSGEMFDQNGAVIIPVDPTNLAPIWCYLSSPEYHRAVRLLDSKTGVTPATLAKVPYDATRWRTVASSRYPRGLPKPHSVEPTQWLFGGHPSGSDQPLHVAAARLVGYRWPRQTGSSFPDCPALGTDGFESHADAEGIVTLSSLADKASAADRLRALLADAYGPEWSATRLAQLVGNGESLEVWLRDRFFEEHCQIFDQRPFVWHVWDGRTDGFHVLVNYHKLAASNGEGRSTLEKLIYTYLGRWIERQTDEVKAGKEGADGRLTAATLLKTELEKILEGEKPYDLFVRWKPLHEQPIGWEPDVNDGVRLNIRPWLTAKVHQPARRDGCILRVTPRVPYGKDRGKEPHRPKGDFPWFWTWDGHTDNFMGGEKFDGVRWNDAHYSPDKKKAARALTQVAEATK